MKNYFNSDVLDFILTLALTLTIMFIVVVFEFYIKDGGLPIDLFSLIV